MKTTGIKLLLAACAALAVTGCKKSTPERIMPMTVREIIDKYYAGTGFYFGCTPGKVLLDGGTKLTLFLEQFSYSTPENSFKQRFVYPSPGAEWDSKEYSQWLVHARRSGQVVRCHGPVGPQCSEWAENDSRTAAELAEVADHYMTELARDLERNKDVVRWMDVVNETVVPNTNAGRVNPSTGKAYQAGEWMGPLTGVGNWENPWLAIGLNEDGIPKYIVRAFELANLHAPSIKKLYNQHAGMQKAAWDKVKSTVLYLRSKGQKVDAVGWQGHVTPGWESNGDNMAALDALIDWCYQNNLEFHVTELDVQFATAAEATEKAPQAVKTLSAIIGAVAAKAGRGAVGVNMWTLTSRTGTSAYFTGIFNNAASLQSEAYMEIKRVLIEKAPHRNQNKQTEYENEFEIVVGTVPRRPGDGRMQQDGREGLVQLLRGGVHGS